MFDIEQAMRFNDVESVDVEFSAIFAEVNFTNDLFIFNDTYNNQMEERAGQVFVRRVNKSSTVGTVATEPGGLDFNTEQVGDDLLVMNKIYTLSTSRKIYGAIEAARKNGTLYKQKEITVRSHNEAWNAQGVALLLGGKNGGTTASNFTPSANTTPSTAETIVGNILSDDTQIIESDATANVILVSPRTAAMLLSKLAVGQGFLPSTNETARRNGVVGDLFGKRVIVTNFLGQASGIVSKIINKTGQTSIHQDILDGSAAATNVEYIIYDMNTWYMDDVFEGMRELAQVPGFFGSQVELQTVSGALNTNPERAIVKFAA